MKFFLSILLAIAATLAGNAQCKLSPYSLNYLQQYKAGNVSTESGVKSKSRLKAEIVDGKPSVLTIVRLENVDNMPDFAATGATIEAQIDDILVVRMPVDNVEQVAAYPAVKRLSIETPIKLKNKVTREKSLVNKVHESIDLAGNAIKGKNVVVGIIDSGIDYNHINFKDADGNSRVKCVMNGSKYYTSASQIASLTTDDSQEDHGTHTSGTAAGSYSANNLQGMAPEADLVLCGLTNLSDANMLLACQRIVDYAKSEGKPCVINMSIGHNSGPHDGSDDFNVALSKLAGQGVIFVIASGNEGDMQIYLNKKFKPEAEKYDSVKTVIADLDNDGDYYLQSRAEVWNFQGKVPEVELYVINASNNSVLLKTDRISLAQGKSSYSWSLSSSSYYTKFKSYYTSYSGLSPNISVTMAKSGNYGSISIQIMGASKSAGKYYVAMGLFSNEESEIHVWGADSNTEFRRNGSSLFTAGDASRSFNPMCCGDEILSVGAYNGANTYTGLDGYNYSYPGYTLNDITEFSSYGEGFNGESYPDICAPGLAVQSSYNTYHKTYNSDLSDYVNKQTVNGKTYYWGTMSGTSMATPAVTGIIATWLQYKPTLTGSEIRDIFYKSAKTDTYVNKATNCCWGAGKIDAYAGLQCIMASGVNDVEVSQNQVLVYPNPNGGQFKVFTQGEENGATLNVFSASGALVYTCRIDASHEAADVDIAGVLAPGIYLVQVVGEKVNYSTRMAIK